MRNQDITIRAHTDAELTKRIQDNEKRGYSLVTRKSVIGSFAYPVYIAVMKKGGEESAGIR